MILSRFLNVRQPYDSTAQAGDIKEKRGKSLIANERDAGTQCAKPCVGKRKTFGDVVFTDPLLSTLFL